jgi:predicted flap endonuclease-1-like 5' DNA nuclease
LEVKMPLDRSTRTFIAALLWVAAAFILINNIIGGSELDDWLLPLLLIAVGAVVYFWADRIFAPRADTVEEDVVDQSTRSDTLVTPAPLIPSHVEPVQLVTPVEASTESVDTQERSDAIAAEGSPAPQELQDPVENMLTTPTASLEETEEVASPPTAYIASPAPEINAPAEALSTPSTLNTPNTATVSPAASPQPDVTPVQADTESVDTQERSDALAAEGSLAPEELQDPVENMLTTPTASLEETSEVSGPPGRSISHGEEVSDDLTLIEGIGPKMSAALISAGINTFAKLAQASEEDLRSAIVTAGMRFSPSLPTWPEQAQYAARGDMDGLRTFQQTLTSGRKKG